MSEKTLTYDSIQEWQEAVYVDFHQHPELSMQEHRTRRRVCEELQAMGIDPIEIGGGVVGTIDRGAGPTVLLRADYDALPVKEETGLPYASTVEVMDREGQKVPVMHACGHDVHIASLLAAGRLLKSGHKDWRGTVHLLFQPGEETGEGSAAMVADGLASKITPPDVVLGQHVFCGDVPTGSVALRSGPFMSTATNVEITFYGVGSHGSMPHLGVDPILMASSAVTRLQGIVSRELNPHEFGVVTVGVISGGSKPNVIPESCTLQLNVRAYSDQVREQILQAIERIAISETQASGGTKMPDITYYQGFPLTENDEEVTSRVARAFKETFGSEQVRESEPLTASEDFSVIADAFGAPYCYWVLGGAEAGVSVPNHSPHFAPQMQPTLRTGAEALVAAALEFLD
ncbi:amidohydrolase [Corynebacterium riegelii]|uniref:amidohydrolase n=1 Tax=Corynebacterium riegelii TaxID=156976 RepID=UPI00191FF5D7|nr:amidohydrolase [Corynebacterium riegelii]QQU83322.1 amidohydrolase [Corynebacterium riegelii]